MVAPFSSSSASPFFVAPPDLRLGLSSVFSEAPGVGPLFPGCTRLAMQLYPELPLVGFERGDDLVAAERAGFERAGALRVWNRAPG